MSERKSLQVLAEPSNREAILLAEVAGLLHNIGKLDPNFLAQRVKDDQNALGIVGDRYFDIPKYQFRRFTAPIEDLWRPEIRHLVFHRQWRPDEGEEAFLQALAQLNVWTEPEQKALQVLLTAWDDDDTKKAHPFIARMLQAAWRLFSFRWEVNGPLYFRRASEQAQLQQTLAELKQEVARLTEAVKTASSDEEATTGRQLGDAKQRRNTLSREIEQLRASEVAEQEALEARFRELVLTLGGESWSMADLLTFFWDRPFFYIPDGDFSSRRSALRRWLVSEKELTIPTLLVFSHGAVSGGDKGTLPEDQEDDTSSDDTDSSPRPPWAHLRLATAFGYETHFDVWHLSGARRQFVEEVLRACQKDLSTRRDDLVATARRNLSITVGDSRWPWNEISLWNYAASIAALFKAAAAQAVLEGQLPIPAHVQWRLLSIRYDGLRYLAQAHHLSDLLARRDLLMAAHEEVLALIEVEYPLGNEVYRDENGAVLVVPHVMGEDGQDVDLLALPAGDESNLKSLIEARFGSGGHHPLEGELQPLIALSQGVPGKGLRLDQAPGWTDPPLHSNPTAVTKWWEDEKRQGEVCTVCGLRPMGYGAPEKDWQRHLEEEHRPGRDPLHCKVCKAQSRSVCWVCMERREDRSRNWAENRDDEQTHTIWTDEVADANGRFALLVGRFDLDGWLDGTLVATMRKSASFARVRRCWETTRQFWDDVGKRSIPQRQMEDSTREGIIPADQRRLRIDGHFAPAPGTQGLGRYHVYELDVEGISLSAVWVPQDKGGYFLTADNLCYLARQLGATEYTWCNSLTAASFVLNQVTGKDLTVNEPSGYSVPASKRGTLRGATAIGTELPPYTPHIPILAQPSTFMALVPADKALAVAQAIKARYDVEMARVRDRLPLHLGLVFAPRRTPLRAVLEAGRAMLEMPDAWEEWEVVSKEITEKTLDDGSRVPGEATLHLRPTSPGINPPTEEAKGAQTPSSSLLQQASASQPDDSSPGDGAARLTLRYPLLMGDERTPDAWYPHLLLYEPDERLKEKEQQGKEPELKKQDGDFAFVTQATGTVYIRPSTFDFVFLDTTARRFDLNYTQGRRQRLYLEQLDELETLWHLLAGKPEGAGSRVSDGWQGLTNTQIHGLNGLIEAKRGEWNVAKEGDPGGTFARLVRDALARANWPGKNGWARLGELTGIADAQEQLAKAGVDRTLARTIELHSSILKLESQRK